MAKYNDLDKKRWKEYTDVLTDSLWLIKKRDSSGAHTSFYHGNFIPQIPHQLFSRYTKKNDWILDPFLGSGTSLIEAQRMGRNAIGIEIQEEIATRAKELIKSELNKGSDTTVLVGDSRKVDISPYIEKIPNKKLQFIIFHPPYWDIVKFSELEDDLSNAISLDDFLKSFATVVDNTTQFLEKDRYCACVIGDKYSNGQVVPLGFSCMNIFLKKGFLLKAIIVKDIGETKGKGNQQGIWRYRALASDFFIFKHEYILIFKKVK